LNLAKLFNTDNGEFVFNLLNLEDHEVDSLSPKRFWYGHIRDNINTLQGDILEFGVYKGRSLFSMASLLKRLKSNKIVYGFDTFSGFPNVKKTELEYQFSKDDLIKFSRNKLYKEIEKQKINLSSGHSISSGFEDINFKKDIKDKIDLFELDNIVLIKGDFSETLDSFIGNLRGTIASINIDCDLGTGYSLILDKCWEKLEVGGLVYLDEYYSIKYPGPMYVVDEFLKKEKTAKLVKHNTRKREFPRYSLVKLG